MNTEDFKSFILVFAWSTIITSNACYCVVCDCPCPPQKSYVFLCGFPWSVDPSCCSFPFLHIISQHCYLLSSKIHPEVIHISYYSPRELHFLFKNPLGVVALVFCFLNFVFSQGFMPSILNHWSTSLDNWELPGLLLFVNKKMTCFSRSFFLSSWSLHVLWIQGM